MEFLSEIKGLDLICQFLIKSTLVLTLSFVLIFLFRKKSATLRHFLLSVSLISLLLLPFFTAFTKGWKTGLLPSWQTEKNSSLKAGDWKESQKIPPRLGLLDTAVDLEANPVTFFEKPKNTLFKFLKTTSITSLIGLLLLTIWTAGLLFLLSRIFLGLYGAYRLTRQAKRLSNPTWGQLLSFFLKAVSIKRKINLLSHTEIKVPLTWGVIRPVVIFPDESRNWTRNQCSSALFHELSHIKRSDFLIKILARLSCAFYWFNPFSWFAFQWMKKEQEKACDELVLKAGVKPSIYAGNLLSIKKAGHLRWNPPSAVLGAVGKSLLNERLTAILRQQFSPKEVKMKTKVLLSILVIATIAFIGLARPSQSAALIETDITHQEIGFTKTQPLPQEKAEQENQEKKKTEKTEQKESKEKKEKVKTITWDTKSGKTIKITFSADRSDEVKTIKIVGHPDIHVDKDSGEKTITLHLPESSMAFEKDEEGHWSIKTDKLHFFKALSIKPLELKHNLKHRLKQTLKLKEGKAYTVVASPKVELKTHPKLEALHTKPHFALHLAPHIKTYTLCHTESVHEKLQEKLEKIREKLKQIRKNKDLDAAAREQILIEIEEELEELSEQVKEKSEDLEDIKTEIYTKAKKIHLDEPLVIKKIEDGHAHIVVKEDKQVIGLDDKKDKKFKICIKSHITDDNKGTYGEVIEKLKAKLPESCKVESKIDEEDGTITITISGVDEEDNTKKTIKEIIKELKEKLAKKKT
jgi:beta-lactamase regulating signal transducer with metallopeptidase domain